MPRATSAAVPASNLVQTRSPATAFIPSVYDPYAAAFASGLSGCGAVAAKATLPPKSRKALTSAGVVSLSLQLLRRRVKKISLGQRAVVRIRIEFVSAPERPRIPPALQLRLQIGRQPALHIRLRRIPGQVPQFRGVA